MTTPAVAELVAVIAIRTDGRRVLYTHADSRAAAEATVAALDKIKLRAEIAFGIARTVRPGTAIPQTAIKRAIKRG